MIYLLIGVENTGRKAGTARPSLATLKVPKARRNGIVNDTAAVTPQQHILAVFDEVVVDDCERYRIQAVFPGKAVTPQGLS